MKAVLLGSLEMLADTSDHWRKAFRQSFLDHGLQFEPRGARPRRSRRDIQPRKSEAVSVDVVLRARNDHFGRALAEGPIRPRAGLTDLLDMMAMRGIALGLVATTPFDWSVSVFDGLGLEPERFDAIVTETHILADKPAPDCYHLAAAMLATAPEDCLAVETGQAGVNAARAARMQV
ncbi:HAD family hydrolase, partial [Jannaschia sp.]|nr:HAD family hydrolase [Jannaschia sp.]